MSERPGEGVPCECGRGDVAVAMFQRGTSLLVRRIGDMGHWTAAEWRCIDCVADGAEEVARNEYRSWHPDFGGPGSQGSAQARAALVAAKGCDGDETAGEERA